MESNLENIEKNNIDIEKNYSSDSDILFSNGKICPRCGKPIVDSKLINEANTGRVCIHTKKERILND